MGAGLGKALVLLALVLVAVAVWRALNRGNGQARAVAEGAEPRLSAADLGQPLGAGATFVQFSSPACAPCRAAARVFAGLAGEDTSVAHVEVDATVRDDLARAHRVLRTPTTLVLDAEGRVARRISGAPTPVQAREALAGLAGTGNDR